MDSVVCLPCATGTTPVPTRHTSCPKGKMSAELICYASFNLQYTFLSILTSLFSTLSRHTNLHVSFPSILRHYCRSILCCLVLRSLVPLAFVFSTFTAAVKRAFQVGAVVLPLSCTPTVPTFHYCYHSSLRFDSHKHYSVDFTPLIGWRRKNQQAAWTTNSKTSY